MVFTLIALLAGCSTMRSYDAELYRTLDQAGAGNVDGAIRLLESNNRLSEKDLLYYLELGMLQRLGARYGESQKAWMSAAARMQSSGDSLSEISNLLRGASSYIVGDKARAYTGHDYEKVMLLTFMALNHLAMGDFDNARVAIKQTHELEAQIAELRRKLAEEVEDGARKRGARSTFKELNGYPIQTIDNPEVNALRNGYQSALSHYLAGFVYEALGEPSLAAPG
ncbi:MAG: COG3014 family protein, partial [Burkholderiales bacterium]